MARFDCIPLQWLEHFEWWLRVTGWGGVLTMCEPADAVMPDCAIEVTVVRFVPTGHGFCVSAADYGDIGFSMAACSELCEFVQFVSGDRLRITGYDGDNDCVLLDGDARFYVRVGDTVWLYAYDPEAGCPPPDDIHIGQYPALRICTCPCPETTGDPCNGK